MITNKYITYRIDSDDKIIYVNHRWKRFADDNNATSLTKEIVIGRYLWDFIAGAEVVDIYKAIIQKVRERKTSIILPYRCDSADTIRCMNVTIKPLDSGELEFQNEILTEESRDTLNILLADVDRSNVFVRMCAWCKAIELPTGWADLADAVSVLKLFDTREIPKITHGICNSCKDMIHQKIGSGR